MIKKKVCKPDITIIAQNKRVRHKYSIEQEFEAGISLQGWEVKSLRAGKADISNGYIILNDNEAYLLGVTFQPPTMVYSHMSYDPIRTRKLLLNKRELDFLVGRVNYKGYTAVTLSLYWKKLWIKVKIGLGKGKKKYDRRAITKEREWQLDKARIMKHTSK